LKRACSAGAVVNYTHASASIVMAGEWPCETRQSYVPTSTLPHIRMEVKASDAFR